MHWSFFHYLYLPLFISSIFDFYNFIAVSAMKYQRNTTNKTISLNTRSLHRHLLSSLKISLMPKDIDYVKPKLNQNKYKLRISKSHSVFRFAFWFVCSVAGRREEDSEYITIRYSCSNCLLVRYSLGILYLSLVSPFVHQVHWCIFINCETTSHDLHCWLLSCKYISASFACMNVFPSCSTWQIFHSIAISF